MKTKVAAEATRNRANFTILGACYRTSLQENHPDYVRKICMLLECHTANNRSENLCICVSGTYTLTRRKMWKFLAFLVEILIGSNTHTALQHMIFQFGGKNIRWHVALNQVSFFFAAFNLREKTLRKIFLKSEIKCKFYHRSIFNKLSQNKVINSWCLSLLPFVCVNLSRA